MNEIKRMPRIVKEAGKISSLGREISAARKGLRGAKSFSKTKPLEIIKGFRGGKSVSKTKPPVETIKSTVNTGKSRVRKLRSLSKVGIKPKSFGTDNFPNFFKQLGGNINGEGLMNTIKANPGKSAITGIGAYSLFGNKRENR